MIIAQQLATKNRIEYLLYMWQVEDILRAYGCDSTRITTEYLATFTLQPEEVTPMQQWYADLCDMMRAEGVQQQGHLQISQNILISLQELHVALSASDKYPFYRAAYYKILPYVVEVRSKETHKTDNEIEVCANILYGVLLLRLQHKEISAATAEAVQHITTFLGLLSDYYLQDKQQPLEL